MMSSTDFAYLSLKGVGIIYNIYLNKKNFIILKNKNVIS